MNRMVNIAATAAFCIAATLPLQASEGPHVAPLKDYAAEAMASWAADPVLIEAVKAQNTAHEALTQAEIDAMDKKWRAEVEASDRPMIDEKLASPLSKWLADMREKSGGFITEVFVMDNKGLNVGQSDVTSDYWQGDEAKWQKTYKQGGEAVFVDEVEMDESTQTLQSQVSLSVVDPATKAVIGAVTVGVNVDAL